MLDLIIKNGECYINGRLENNDIAIKNGKVFKIGKILEEAKKVLEEYQKSGGGAIKVDGQMIDEPIAEAMRLKITLGEEEKD